MSDHSASRSVPEHYRRRLSATWDTVLQQQTQKFASAGILEPLWTGKEFVYTDLDATDAVERTNQRFGDTNPDQLTGGSRKGYKRLIEKAIIKDVWDDAFLDAAAVPDSDVMMNMKSAVNRKMDDIWIDAASAAALGGAEPYNTAIPLPNSSKVAVNYIRNSTGSNSNLTPWKLLEVKKRFEAAEVDLDQEELVLAMSPNQKMGLAAYAESATNELWAKVVGQWLADSEKGIMTKLMGFRVIISNRLPVASNIRQCVAFTQSAFKVSPMDRKFMTDSLPTKRYALQFFSTQNWGAVRVKDAKVQLVYCDETV